MAEIDIEIVFAMPEKTMRQTFRLPGTCTLAQAIARASLPPEAEASVRAGLYGINGKRRAGDTPLRSGDRVEIYRPLSADPKDLRRRREKASS